MLAHSFSQKIEYYMSQTSRKVLGSLTQDYLWIRTLANQKESNLTDKLNTITKEFQVAANAHDSAAAGPRSGRRAEDESDSSRPVLKMNARTKEWDKAVTHLADVATEQLAETTLQNAKKHIFS